MPFSCLTIYENLVNGKIGIQFCIDGVLSSYYETPHIASINRVLSEYVDTWELPECLEVLHPSKFNKHNVHVLMRINDNKIERVNIPNKDLAKKFMRSFDPDMDAFLV